MTVNNAKPADDPREFILEEAEKASLQIIAARKFNTRHKKSVENYTRIHDISKALLADKDQPIRPDAEGLVRFAAIGGVPMMAVQTIRNSYRNMTAIWIEAHTKLVALLVSDRLANPRKRKSRGIEIDAEIQSLEDVIRVLYIENCDLRSRMSNADLVVTPSSDPSRFRKVSDPMDDGASAPSGASFVDMRPVRAWVKDLSRDDSYLRITELGLKLSPLARPNFTIVPKDVFEVFKSL
ncbi:hypothetical protein BJF93_20435 [Xaviernesmea oryzae]|uniref:Uncharacterized protein n=1 Tax=Xaviernesmea oryzae TaxID=464029 RepID=A0A1Q9AVZ8_9HYPH|nr:hypothetical protein [Xaviernesmea oryzae]OLP59584.1 hypothetical protein BJF93_20435 [Xaviernesmea oryzae]SEM12868.1 hypothetical protein SAMN04487976_12023 [Xaviernesmea oryzae]